MCKCPNLNQGANLSTANPARRLSSLCVGSGSRVCPVTRVLSVVGARRAGGLGVLRRVQYRVPVNWMAAGHLDLSSISVAQSEASCVASDDDLQRAGVLHLLFAELEALRARHMQEQQQHEDTYAGLVAEHRHQMAALRSLLDAEADRAAAARADVLAVTVAAGNERLALHAELARCRRQSNAHAADESAVVQTARSEAEEREDSLRRQLRSAERQIELQTASMAKALAAATVRARDDGATITQLRKDLDTMSSTLRAAQVQATKAEGRAAKQSEENKKLVALLNASEQRVQSLRSRSSVLRPPRRVQTGSGTTTARARSAR